MGQEKMKNYGSCSIWQLEPGKAGYIYFIDKIVKQKDRIDIYFDEEHCVILDPMGFTYSDKVLSVEDAKEIIWNYETFHGGVKNNTIHYINKGNNEIEINDDGKISILKGMKFAFKMGGSFDSVEFIEI